MKRTLLVGAVAVVLSACGPDAALWLRVEAPLRVPEECDRLELEVRSVARGVLVFQRSYALKGGLEFPLTLSLGTSNDADLDGPGLSVSAKAMQGEALARPWSQAVGGVVLHRGTSAALTLRLCDCP